MDQTLRDQISQEVDRTLAERLPEILRSCFDSGRIRASLDVSGSQIEWSLSIGDGGSDLSRDITICRESVSLPSPDDF